MKKEIKIYECGCERCGHKWITRSEDIPKVCPNCKSPYWDIPRKKKD
jgi:Zn finger protein HypA/HybF involved in hydrogenase expression